MTKKAIRLLAGNDLEPIEQAVSAVMAVGNEYLDAPVATEAVAAIEVLACLLGMAGDSEPYTGAVDAWLKRVELNTVRRA